VASESDVHKQMYMHMGVGLSPCYCVRIAGDSWRPAVYATAASSCLLSSSHVRCL
jgi:hypothetical protein